MSHQATRWALKQRGLKPAAKIVLFYLCDHHNDENGCFPSQELLASECEISRASLNNQLNHLEERGLIRRHASVDSKTKRQRPTRYILGFEEDFNVQNLDESRVQNLDKAVSENKTRSVSKKHAEPCPKNDESRVQNMDTNPVREPLSQAKPREAGPGLDRVLRMRADLIAAMGLTGTELNTSGTFIVRKMSPADIEMSLDVWSKDGLTDQQIIAAVTAKMLAERERDQSFLPKSVKFFDGAISDHAKRLNRPAGKDAPTSVGSETPAQRRARRQRMIGG